MKKVPYEKSQGVEEFSTFLAKLVPEPKSLKDTISNLNQERLAVFLEELEAMDSQNQFREHADDARNKLFAEHDEHKEQELLALRNFHEFLENNQGMELLRAKFGDLAVDLFMAASEKRKTTAENYEVVMTKLQNELIALEKVAAEAKQQYDANPMTLSEEIRSSTQAKELRALLAIRSNKRMSKK